MPHRPTLRAVIYVRSLDDINFCLAHCAARGYPVYGVVHDEDGSKYHDLTELAQRGGCEVIVIRRLGDLPEGRVPRTEIAEAPQVEAAQEVRPRRRRPGRRR